MEKHRGFIKGALFGALIMLLVVVGCTKASDFMDIIISGNGVRIKQEKAEQAAESKLKKISRIIDQYYLYSDDVTQEDLEDGIYSGFLNALGDPYTVYYDEEETKEILESTSGEYSGIGAAMTKDTKTGEIVIATVYEESPAEKAGLQAGDILFQVDDHEVGDSDTEEVISWIKGEEGTEVSLHVYRGEEREEQVLTAIRGIVQKQTVEYEMKENKVGYIYISEFDKVTYEQFENAFNTLENQGMQGLVVDLRNNPGGNVDTVVDILRLLLPEGNIVSTKDKYGRTENYDCDGTHEFQKPLAVLVNQYSASASEIFAGAVQDYEIGEIVGMTTYGKGIVQELLNLGDGTMLKTTTAEYFTPSGESIHKKGVKPDVEIEYEYDESRPDADNQLEKALQIINEQI